MSSEDVNELIQRAAVKMRVRPEDVRFWSWPETFSTTGGPSQAGGMTPTVFQVFAFESDSGDTAIKYCNGAWKKWDGYTQTW